MPDWPPLAEMLDDWKTDWLLDWLNDGLTRERAPWLTGNHYSHIHTNTRKTHAHTIRICGVRCMGVSRVLGRLACKQCPSHVFAKQDQTQFHGEERRSQREKGVHNVGEQKCLYKIEQDVWTTWNAQDEVKEHILKEHKHIKTYWCMMSI